MLAALVQVAQTVGSAVAPAAAPVAEDPRSALELAIQAFGAVVIIVGATVIMRQLIYKQFGGGNCCRHCDHRNVDDLCYALALVHRYWPLKR